MNQSCRHGSLAWSFPGWPARSEWCRSWLRSSSTTSRCTDSTQRGYTGSQDQPTRSKNSGRVWTRVRLPQVCCEKLSLRNCVITIIITVLLQSCVLCVIFCIFVVFYFCMCIWNLLKNKKYNLKRPSILKKLVFYNLCRSQAGLLTKLGKLTSITKAQYSTVV